MTVGIGAQGDDVVAVQRALIDAGSPPVGGADGVYGPATASAVSSFQAAQGLTVTGEVDEATAVALGLRRATPSSWVGLSVGARGDAVAAVQSAIAATGISVAGGADGIFGPGTERAVAAFQEARGLAVSGRIDQRTAAALANAGGSSPSAQPSAPPPAAAPDPLVGLRIGATGDAVATLQRKLMGAGFNVVGGADGIFGVNTVNALVQYQYSAGVRATARVDEATAAALAKVEAAPSAAPAPQPAPEPQAPASPNPLVGLAPGVSGPLVAKVQQAMLDAGLTFPGGADGIFGPATANALRSFQTSQGLEATGRVDAGTAAALADPKPIGAPPVTGSVGYAVYNEQGLRVVALQEALLKAGISFRGGVDGRFGGATSGAVMDVQRRNGLRVTGVVDDATARTIGLSPMEQPSIAEPPPTVTLQQFPVQGPCFFGDTWHAPRSGGRVHVGVDIGAARGKNVYAVSDGRITRMYRGTSLAGNGVYLTASDGTYFFYAHLDEFHPDLRVGMPVKAGQIIGTIGSTGNAGVPHLHFEIHPGGGVAVNPYPAVKAVDGCSTSEVPPQGF